jgi:hypothetical protein
MEELVQEDRTGEDAGTHLFPGGIQDVIQSVGIFIFALLIECVQGKLHCGREIKSQATFLIPLLSNLEMPGWNKQELEAQEKQQSGP